MSNSSIGTAWTGTNWAGNYTYGASAHLRPSSVEALADIIRTEPSLRMVGSRHSFTGIGDAAVLVDGTGLRASAHLDRHARTITVSGADTFADVASFLDGTGFALHNLASLPHISVAGAIATATHGSGVGNGNLATAVRSVQFLDGLGELHTIDRTDADFDGVVVSLGALGAVVRLTLDLVPDFEVAQSVVDDVSLDAVAARLTDVLAAAYSVSVFTAYGDAAQVWLKRRIDDAGERAGGSGPDIDVVADFGAHVETLRQMGGRPAAAPRHPVNGLDPTPCTRQLGVPGPWWDRLPHFRMGFTPSAGDEVQSEYFVEASRGADALHALRGVAADFASQLMVSEIRAVAADELWMSPQYRQDTVGFHFTWHPDSYPQGSGLDAAIGAVEAALAPLAPRPHWGKVFQGERFPTASSFPRHLDFVDLVDRFDPRGVFRNAWFDRHIGDPDVTPLPDRS